MTAKRRNPDEDYRQSDEHHAVEFANVDGNALGHADL